MLKQMQEAMFKKADKNGDGKISADEMSQMASADKSQNSTSAADMFSQMDTDSDGAVSRLESDAAIAKMSQQSKPQGPPPPPEETDESSSSSSGDSSLKSLLETLSSALESGNSSDAQKALTALEKQAASNGSSSSDNPFLKDLESVGKAIESGSTDDAQSILAGIQEKVSAGPPPPPKPGGDAQSRNSDSQDSVASSLQTLLDSLKDDSSATSGSMSNDLKSILTAAIQSYMQQSAASYGQGSASNTQTSSTFYA